MIDIHNVPCACPPGQCAAGVDRDWLCINRQPEAHTEYCQICLITTWHSAGRCLACEEK